MSGALLIFAPLLPLIGLQIFAFHAHAVVLAARQLSQPGRRIKLRWADLALALFIVAYGGSLFVALISGTWRDRIAASAYNWSYWVMGLLLLVALGNMRGRKTSHRMLRGMHVVFIVSSMFGLVALALWMGGYRFLEINNPLAVGRFDDFTLLQSSFRIRLVQPDYLFARALPRTSAFANYPTAYGAVLVISAMGSVLARKIGAVRPRRVYMLVWPFTITSVFLTGARGTLLGLGAVLIVAALASRRPGRGGIGFVAGLAALFIAGALVRGDLVKTSASESEGIRYGSTQTRLALYEKAITVWGRSPLVGVGIKPTDSSNFPVGSHSTFVGLLLRTGVLGLGIFIVFLVMLWKELWQRLKAARDPTQREIARTALLVLAFISVWMLSEDLDAPQLVAYMFFAIIGMSRIGAEQVIAHTGNETVHAARPLAEVSR